VSECTEGQDRSDDESGDASFQHRLGKPPPRRAALLSWEETHRILRECERISSSGQPVSRTMTCAGIAAYIVCRETIMSDLLNGTGLEAMRVP
jgi:hypothetical protein